MKVCVLGCGLRTPLLVHGLVHSKLAVSELALFDTNPARACLTAKLASQIAVNTPLRVSSPALPEQALDGASFVISSIRVGHMEARAADERIALECGFAGQETTGPAGFAMGLRTIPVAIQYARLAQKVAPQAWLVNFTNPAGMIAQAIATHTGAKVLGICDTPVELFHQIARSLGEPLNEVRCDYFGLNHLGWVRAVHVRGHNMMPRLLGNADSLRHLYPVELFPPALIRALGMIPTEYLYFYYNQSLARENQSRAGVTRGEELAQLNTRIWAQLETCVAAGDLEGALAAYRRYLNRRNASYMRLEGSAQSAFDGPDPDWDPFEGATGYHRIAVETIAALTGATPRIMVLNVRNQGAIEGLGYEDVVEVPCTVDDTGARPLAIGELPAAVRGLVFAVKQYERLAIQAAVEQDWEKAVFALMTNPIVGSWDAARKFLERLSGIDTLSFASFKNHDILRSELPH